MLAKAERITEVLVGKLLDLMFCYDMPTANGKELLDGSLGVCGGEGLGVYSFTYVTILIFPETFNQ